MCKDRASFRGTMMLSFRDPYVRIRSFLGSTMEYCIRKVMGAWFSMQRIMHAYAPQHVYSAEKANFAQLIAATVTKSTSELVGQSVSKGLELAGGAAGMFKSLKDPDVIVPDSPLYWLVDGASILNYPPDGNPDENVTNGRQKPDRTQAMFAWTALRLQALWQWVYTNGATFAGALYAVFNALPLVQVTRNSNAACAAASSSGRSP